MKIQVSENRDRILLTTPNMSYGIIVTSFGRVCNSYWGAPLADVSEVPVELDLHNYPFEEENNKQWYQQEFPGWGGYFYDEPCIKLSPKHAERGLRLVFENLTVVDDCELQIKLCSETQPVSVTLHYHLSNDDVLVRYARVCNKGTTSLAFSNIYSGAVHLPGQYSYDARYLAGKWAGEHQIRTITPSQGKFILESRRGISGPDANPWIAFTPEGMGSEETGDAYSCALEWCGNWKLCVEKNRYNQLTVLGGWNDYDDVIYIDGDSEIVTPKMMLTYSGNGFGGISRQMHQHIRSYMPTWKGTDINPLIYNSWEACFFDFDINMQFSLAEKAADIGAEIFVVDDGWFTNRDDDTAGLGDWIPDPRKFPNGLLPLSKRVQELGMVFGLWAEPEMVSPTSKLASDHPDWVIAFDVDDPPLARTQLVLNLARQDVKDYVLSVWDKLIGDNEIGYIKWDMNRYLCEPGWRGNKSKTQSIWRNYGRHLYEVLEKLTQKYPNLFIENCCSGGGRAEPGMYRYCRIVSRSDNADTLDGLKLFEGYTQAYPPETAIASVSSCPNGINGRTVPLEYRARMAMMGTMQVGLNLNLLDAEVLQELKRYTKQYKHIREVVQNATLYRLVSAYDSPYAAYQFVSDDRNKCVVFVFGQSLQFRELQPKLRLKGLVPDASYRVGEQVFSGRVLMQAGLPLSLNGDYASVLWEINGEEDKHAGQR